MTTKTSQDVKSVLIAPLKRKFLDHQKHCIDITHFGSHGYPFQQSQQHSPLKALTGTASFPLVTNYPWICSCGHPPSVDSTAIQIMRLKSIKWDIAVDCKPRYNRIQHSFHSIRIPIRASEFMLTHLSSTPPKSSFVTGTAGLYMIHSPKLKIHQIKLILRCPTTT